MTTTELLGISWCPTAHGVALQCVLSGTAARRCVPLVIVFQLFQVCGAAGHLAASLDGGGRRWRRCRCWRGLRVRCQRIHNIRVSGRLVRNCRGGRGFLHRVVCAGRTVRVYVWAVPASLTNLCVKPRRRFRAVNSICLVEFLWQPHAQGTPAQRETWFMTTWSRTANNGPRAARASEGLKRSLAYNSCSNCNASATEGWAHNGRGE